LPIGFGLQPDPAGDDSQTTICNAHQSAYIHTRVSNYDLFWTAVM
jgi:hypothetical protein